jgi:hypothetical protein
MEGEQARDQPALRRNPALSIARSTRSRSARVVFRDRSISAGVATGSVTSIFLVELAVYRSALRPGWRVVGALAVRFFVAITESIGSGPRRAAPTAESWGCEVETPPASGGSNVGPVGQASREAHSARDTRECRSAASSTIPPAGGRASPCSWFGDRRVAQAAIEEPPFGGSEGRPTPNLGPVQSSLLAYNRIGTKAIDGVESRSRATPRPPA